MNADKTNFQIVGRINGKDTGKIVLTYKNAVNEYVSDTTTLDHGKFTFSGSVRSAGEALIWTNLQAPHFDHPSVIRLILQPGLINISKTDGEKATISGSHAQAKKEKWDSVKLPLSEAEEQFYQTIDSLKKLNQQAGRSLFTNRIDSLYRQAGSIRAVLVKLDVDYVAKHPESYLSAFLLRKRCRRLSVDSVKLLYTALADSVKNSSVGYDVLEYLYPLTDDKEFRNKNPLFGQEFTKRLAGIRSMHDFKLRDMSGKLIDFATFKGKYLVVAVWASWCAGCIKNIPVWNNLLKEYDPDVVQFINVSLDTDIDSWKQSVRQHKPGGVQLIDTNAFKGLFAVYSKVLWVSRHLIVNPAGRIVNYDAYQPKVSEWRRLIDGYIKKGTD